MKSFGKLLAFTAVLAMAGTLLAQPAPPAAPAGADSDSTEVKPVTLTLAEMQAQIVESDADVQGDYQHVLRLQYVARREKDVIKLTCINDKLVLMKGFMNVFDKAKLDFESAVGTERSQRYSDVVSATQNVRRMKEEANVCAGESIAIGEGTSSWDGPEFPDDPSKDPFGDGIEPPGYASPYR